MNTLLAGTWTHAPYIHTNTHVYPLTLNVRAAITSGGPGKQNKSASTVSWREGTDTASCIIDRLSRLSNDICFSDKLLNALKEVKHDTSKT